MYDAYVKVAVNYFESTGTLGDAAGAAWDEDGIWVDDHYDINDNPELLDVETRYNIMGGTFTATSNGAADGNLSGLQGKISVNISIIHQ